MSYSSEVLADAPWGFWDHGETAGTTLGDDSGNGRPLTIITNGTSPPTLAQPGPDGVASAISWPAVTGNYAGTSVAVTTSTATLEAWVYLTAYPGEAYAAVIGMATTYGNSTTDKNLGVTSAGKAFFQIFSGSSRFALSTDALSLNAWHHLVGTIGPAGLMLYVDGVLVSSSAAYTTSYTGAAMRVFERGGGLGYASASSMVTAKPAFYTSQLSGSRVAAHYSAGTGVVPPASGVLSATLPAIATTVAGTYIPPAQSGALAATLPGVAAGITGAYTAPGAAIDGTLDITLPGVEVSITGTVGFTTGTDATSGEARDRQGIGYVDYDPPVAPLPVDLTAAAAEVYAQARGPFTITGAEVPDTTYRVHAPAYRYRYVIDGVDITAFRGVRTPGIPYQLVEPFLYNTATLTVPQAVAWAETAGEGDLHWLRLEAPVKIQLIDAATDTKVATVYKGWVKSIDPDGDIYTLQLDGEVLGPATDAFRPQPIFRTKMDIGLLMMRAVRKLGARTASRNGPTTKIVQYRTGGSKMIHYLLETMALAQDKRGRQWTIMPDEQGRYDMFRKDTDTIHFTIYPTGRDGAYPLSIRRDLGVEYNQVFATALSPDGERILFGRYPGFEQTPPPPFPGTLSRGGSGEGVTVLIRRLANFNYLTLDQMPGGYDGDVTEAVERLQRHAHIPVTGVVDQATWRALFDLDVTGKTLRNSRIEPAAAESYTERYKLSASGAIIGFNPDWDPTRRAVAADYDFGAGHRRDKVQDFAEAELDPGTPNWVGTVTIRSGAVVAGMHNPGDPLTSDDLMHASLIKPGMNVWIHSQGGFKARVGIVDVAADGVTTLRIDSRNRDAMKLSAIIDRNRLVAENPARSFWKLFKSGRIKEALAEFSEQGGWLDEGVDLAAGWNIVPFIAGDSGTVQSIEFDTYPPVETAVAMTGEAVVAEVFERNIGDPLTKAGAARWSDPDVLKRLRENHGLLYQAGDNVQPGGYSPGEKTADASILTGEFLDAASVPYYTRRLPLLYLAIYASGSTRIRAGRIVKPNMEPV